MTDLLKRLSKLDGVTMEEAGANRPLALLGSDVWVVAQGKLHLFGQPNAQTRRTLFIETEAGQAMFGFGPEAVIAVGSPGTQVARMSRETFLSLPESSELLRGWLRDTGRFLAPPPSEAQNLSPGETVALEQGQAIGGQELLFLTAEPQALELDSLSCPGLVALPTLLRATATEDTQVTALSTSEAVQRDDLWSAVEFYHQWVRRQLQEQAVSSKEAHSERIKSREALALKALNDGVLRLATSLPGEPPVLFAAQGVSDPLYEAVRLVAEASLIHIKRPAFRDDDIVDPMTKIAQASDFRTRMVRLPNNWWRSDAGHILGSRDGEPVALLRQRPGRYHLVDPTSPQPVRVTAEVAATLDREAFVFYRPLPPSCKTFKGLITFAWPDIKRDVFVVAVLSVLGAIMAMATPIGLGWLVDTVIPSGQSTELIALGLGLALAALVSSTTNIGQAITALRIGSRVDADVQAAITDRLLGLPAPFFRRYSSGDLTNRLLGFQALVQSVTGSLLSAILAVVMTSTNLALMFYYDFWLALVGCLMVSVLMVFLAVCAFVDLSYQRRLAHDRGLLSSLVFQLISGISKLKVAHAETRAFERWSQVFTRRTQTLYRSKLVQSNINPVMKVYNTASLMVFIGYLAHYDYKALTTSNFLALIAAYGAFVGAVNSASASLTSMLTTVPLAERFSPILSQQAEVTEDLPNPGELQGAVEVSHVSFRYGPDDPLVLKDVSLKADPGEFVAVVGPSGSGKSTVFRMLLGFEEPAQGMVMYDGQDLSGVNKQAVRRQLGVVLQNGQLMPGSVLSNIVGSSLLTMEDAWKAAEMAGLADDIRAMPMGMHTVVSEGGGAFSGGQRQRLLIARAVVSQPRILFLDEATSALDSRTQEEVSNQLNQLQATRVVIAHRLSTIEKADRIYVLKDGVVEQIGTYDELVAVPGPFQDLARRQML